MGNKHTKKKFTKFVTALLAVCLLLQYFNFPMPVTKKDAASNNAMAAETTTAETNWDEVYNPVSGITIKKIEGNGTSTTETKTFNGGAITADSAPQVPGYKFQAAYIEINGNNYRLNFLAMVENQVRYAIQGGTQTVGDDKVFATILREGSEKITFEYVNATSYKITYNPVNNNGISQYKDDTLGETRVLGNAPASILPGQKVYFQVERVAGTFPNVTATNGNVTRITQNEQSAVFTFELSNVTQDTEINIAPTWKSASYNVKFNTSTVQTEKPGSMQGQANVGLYNQRIIINGTAISGGVNGYDYATPNATNGNVDISFNETVPLAGDVTGTSIQFRYIVNTAWLNDYHGYFWQGISAIQVNGENVDFPVPLALDANPMEKTIKTTLKNGDNRGTVVTVTRRGQKEGEYDIYDISVGNIHNNIDIKVNYSPMNTQGLILFNEIVGVNVEHFMTWDNGNAQTWYPVNPGTVTFLKYFGSNRDLTWITKPGYYNPEMIMTYLGQSIVIPNDDIDPADGSYVMDIQTDFEEPIKKIVNKGIQPPDAVSVRVVAKPIKYNVEYDANEGFYFDGVPVDPEIYDTAEINQIIVSNVKPERNGAKFTGYKIKNNTKGTIFQPGELVDLSTQVDVDSTVEQATLVFEAQWELDTTTDLVEREIQTKKLNKDKGYDIGNETVLVVEGSEFKLLSYSEILDKADGTPDFELNHGASKLEGMVTADQVIATLQYEKLAEIKYEPGTGTGVTGTAPDPTGERAFTNVTLSDQTFTRPGFTQTGWQVQGSTDKAYELGQQNVEIPYDGLILEPFWEENKERIIKYVVAEDPNGHGKPANHQNNPADGKGEAGTTVPLTAKLETTEKATQAGIPGTWKFTGWFETENSVEEITQLTIPQNANAEVTVYGKWTFTPEYSLEITKKNDTGGTLANAGFKVYKDANGQTLADVYVDEQKTPINDTANQSVTGQNGILTFYGLTPNTYYLKEVVTPAGYTLLEEVVPIVVSNDGTVTVKGQPATISNGKITVTVENKKLVLDVPSTGFGGVMPYIIGGLGLIVVATITIERTKRVRKRQG